MSGELHWYAFHTFRNSRKAFLSSLDSDKVTHYSAMGTSGKPLFPSLVFVQASKEYVLRLRSSLYMLAAPYRIPGTIEPAVIPDSEMDIFRFVISKGCDTMTPCDVNLCKGDRVRVLDGIFKDAEGYILRIKGASRFVVSIQGVVAVATIYIPKNFLEKVE